MRISTVARFAIALAAGLLIAVAVCLGPASRPSPAPTATEAAVSAPSETPAPGTAGSPVPTPTPSPTEGPTPAPETTPIAVAARAESPAATSTPFTLSDLAATSTPGLLPPPLPSVTVPPTPTPTSAPTEPPASAPSPTPTATLAAGSSPSPTATPESGVALAPPTVPYGPQVVVDRTVFTVDVASTPEEKQVGLSGREGLAPTSGMLFLYETGRPYQFWMKGMLFAIDIVWIAPDCTVGDITHELQPPRAGTPDSEVPRATPSVEAAHVLEVAAGASRRLGVEIGDSVRFVDIPGPAGAFC